MFGLGRFTTTRGCERGGSSTGFPAARRHSPAWKKYFFALHSPPTGVRAICYIGVAQEIMHIRALTLGCVEVCYLYLRRLFCAASFPTCSQGAAERLRHIDRTRAPKWEHRSPSRRSSRRNHSHSNVAQRMPPPANRCSGSSSQGGCADRAVAAPSACVMLNLQVASVRIAALVIHLKEISCLETQSCRDMVFMGHDDISATLPTSGTWQMLAGWRLAAGCVARASEHLLEGFDGLLKLEFLLINLTNLSPVLRPRNSAGHGGWLQATVTL